MRSALLIIKILLSAAFLAAAGAKLGGVPELVAIFDDIGLGQWFRYFVALFEIAAVVLLWVPRFAGVGAGMLFGAMVVGAGVHLFHIGGSPAAALALAALSGFATFHHRNDFLRFVQDPD